jgi:hypothetical protein
VQHDSRWLAVEAKQPARPHPPPVDASRSVVCCTCTRWNAGSLTAWGASCIQNSEGKVRSIGRWSGWRMLYRTIVHADSSIKKDLSLRLFPSGVRSRSMSRPGLCTYPLQKKRNSSDLALHCVFARGWLTLPNQPASQSVVLQSCSYGPWIIPCASIQNKERGQAARQPYVSCVALTC